jgi:hypothetical protein
MAGDGIGNGNAGHLGASGGMARGHVAAHIESQQEY